ncbi:MAG TPA: outer membrane lipoprotein-sorting protein [Terriglobia bacterium]|nr:outer membrane lipoprotein-sorting protein [Terriglobia bacterium]
MNLALFSLALPLMTGALNSGQKQSAESYRASDAASGSAGEPKQNSNGMCAPGAHAAPTALAMETTVACMSQAAVQNQTHVRSYTVTREYELFGQKRDKARSRVIADVTFRPPDSKNYRIQATEGSVIGEKIVRLVLEREAALAKNGGASDISRDNYDFQFVREEAASGRRCYVLQLLPKRKDKNLLHGTIWVDAETYLIRRTEGEPQKSPSWWLRDLHIAFVYAQVGEMWLPTSSEFTAKVRLFGVSTMLAHDLAYSYSQLAGAGTIPAAHNTQLAQQRLTGGGPPGQPSKAEQGGLNHVSSSLVGSDRDWCSSLARQQLHPDGIVH